MVRCALVPLDPEIIREVGRRTKVWRHPRQMLATFGITSVKYYLLSEPVYADPTAPSSETVLRMGQLTAERPQIVTPYYLLNLFQGFEHGEAYARYLLETYGSSLPGLLYQYKNEPQETKVLGDPIPAVADRIVQELERREENLAAVIEGVDHLWDISLMKFIYELTISSLRGNLGELAQRGLLHQERGLPRGVRTHIDEMLGACARGDLEPMVLKQELDRWGLFEEYEDRFLGLFRRR